MIKSYRVDELYRSDEGSNEYVKNFTSLTDAKKWFDRLVKDAITDYELEDRLDEEVVQKTETKFIYDGETYDDYDFVNICIMHDEIVEAGEEPSRSYGTFVKEDELLKILAEEKKENPDQECLIEPHTWPGIEK